MEQGPPYLYFAYGSNLSLRQMQERCPGCVPLLPATLKGYELAFTGDSRRWGGAVATVTPSANEEVHGLLYHLDDSHVASLDFYEDHPFVYRREEIEVECEVLGPTAALTYIMPLVERRPAAERYLKVIFDCYRRLGYPTHPLLEKALWRGGPF